MYFYPQSCPDARQGLYLIDDDQDKQVVFELALLDTGENSSAIWRDNGHLAITEFVALSIPP